MGRRLRAGASAGMAGLAALASLIAGGARGEEPASRALAITQLDYSDTSGEVRDQQADHQRRLEVFTESLRRDLTANGRFHVVVLDCAAAGCAGPADADRLADAARQAGAAYVLVGGIQKMSTLIQNARVAILDAGEHKVVFERLLTFRGDNDVAWQRAEEFLADNILQDSALK